MPIVNFLPGEYMRLTDKTYWDKNYARKVDAKKLSMDDFRTFPNRQLFSRIQSVGLDKGHVLEVGAGGSKWIPFLAEKYPETQFTGIDYSETGCEMLRDLAKRGCYTNIEVICSDFFSASNQFGRFDVLYSLGVVEHFEDLDKVLTELRRFLKAGGYAINFIPNMAGIIGTLTRIFDPDVYAMHNPHDRESFVRGHREAGFEVVEAGYICSSNFGVLASCFTEQEGLSWSVYKFLTRVSKMIWFLESKTIELPASRRFSPYIYTIARNP